MDDVLHPTVTARRPESSPAHWWSPEVLATNIRLTPDAQMVLARTGGPRVQMALVVNSALTHAAEVTLSLRGDDYVLTQLSIRLGYVPHLCLCIALLDHTPVGRMILMNIRDVVPKVYDALAKDFAGTGEELMAMVESFTSE